MQYRDTTYVLPPTQPLQSYSRLVVSEAVAPDRSHANGVLPQVVAAVGRHAGRCYGECFKERVHLVLRDEYPTKLETCQTKDGDVLTAVQPDIPLEIEVPPRCHLFLVPRDEVVPVVLLHRVHAVVRHRREGPHILPVFSPVKVVGEVTLTFTA